MHPYYTITEAAITEAYKVCSALVTLQTEIQEHLKDVQDSYCLRQRLQAAEVAVARLEAILEPTFKVARGVADKIDNDNK